MDENRTLPPLVRGNVTGFLDFFVDEIRIFRNIYNLNDNCDLVVQVQWWGEILPIYLRPEIVQLPEKYKRLGGLKYYPSTTYKIKTKLDLFKSYLSVCEALELTVLETIDSIIIGSSFLNNLTNILNNKERITLPLVDCLGENIGEIMIHIKYSEVVIEKQLDEKKSKKLISKPAVEVESQKPNLNFMNEKIVVANLQNKKVAAPKIIEVDTHSNNEYIISKLNLNSCLTSPAKSHSTFDEDCMINNFPEVEFVTDPSKVLHFKPQKKQSKITKANVSNKIQKNIQSVKKKSAASINKKEQSSKETTMKVKKKLNDKNQKKVSQPAPSVNFFKSNEERNRILSENTPSKAANSNGLNSEIQASNIPSEISTYQQEDKLGFTEDEELKEVTNKKVLNYLLGSQMSKEDEEDAIRNLKKMSPSQDLVESIHKLVSESSSESFKETKDNAIDPTPNLDSDFVTVFGLNFNLSSAIERKYYERFFQESSPSHGLDIAEFLNHPKPVLESLKSKDLESLPHQLTKIDNYSQIYAQMKEKILNPTKKTEFSTRELENADDYSQIYREMKEKLLKPNSDMKPYTLQPEHTEDCSQIYRRMKEKLLKPTSDIELSTTDLGTTGNSSEIYRKMEENILNPTNDLEFSTQELGHADNYLQIYREMKEKILKPTSDIEFSTMDLGIADNSSEIYRKMGEKILNPTNDIEFSTRELENAENYSQIYREMKEKILKPTSAIEHSTMDLGNAGNYSQIYKKMKEKLLKPTNDRELSTLNPENTDNSSQIYRKMKEKIEKDFKVTVENANCDKCKYFKKLEELDKIIESLKNFEQRIIMQDKIAYQQSGCSNILKSIENNQQAKDS